MRKCFWLVVAGFIMTACSSRPDGVMSQREMKEFLTDLHLLEGLISYDPTLMSDDRMQVYYYNALFSKYGITKADFDSSLVFYTKQPKRFERIYAGVVRNIEALEKEVADGKYEKILPDSIRLKPEIYSLQGLDSLYRFVPDSPRTTLAFAVTTSSLLTGDIYHLRFRMRREPSDSTIGGYAALRIHYADGAVDSLWHATQNDSVLRRFLFRFQAKRNLPIDSLSGVLLGSASVKGKFRVYIDSVSLKREYIPFLQDSIRNQLDTVPPKDTIPTIDSTTVVSDSVKGTSSNSKLKSDTARNATPPRDSRTVPARGTVPAAPGSKTLQSKPVKTDDRVMKSEDRQVNSNKLQR